MKSFSFLLMLFALIFVATPTLDAHTVAKDTFPPRWEKLGQRTVNRSLDRDEITVTAREGTFTSLRLKAERAGVNIHRIVIHFANGQTQAVQVNRTLRAGAVTPNLDLPGNRRVITKVVFWYDSINRRASRGRIELWGRR